MKKLMSFVAAIGLVSSTGTTFSNVVSCSKAKKEEIKSLTYKEGKKDNDFIEVLKNKALIGTNAETKGLLIEGNKLQRDYLDEKVEDEDFDLGNFEGTMVVFPSQKNPENNEEANLTEAFPDFINEIFNEVKGLKNEKTTNDVEKTFSISFYFFAIKGTKNSSNFTTFLYNLKFNGKLSEDSKQSRFKGESTLIYKNTITIS